MINTPLFLIAIISVFFGYAHADDYSILAIGNSITRHGPSKKVGWSNDWGMAASKKNSDYLNQLAALAYRQCGNVVVETLSIVELERSGEAKKIVDSLPEQKQHLVIFQVGDNVKINEKTKDNFINGLNDLLVAAKEKYSGNAFFLCVGPFWKNRFVESIIKKECSEKGLSFVSISDLSVAENYAVLHYPDSSPGVQRHPGDNGMKMIFQKIVSSLPNEVMCER